MIEKLGRGSVLILAACAERGLPAPVWTSDDVRGVTLTFFTPEVTPEVQLVLGVKGEMTRQALQEAVGLKDAEHFRRHYLLPALAAGLLEMTVPDKPRSSRQKYRLSPVGRRMMEKMRTNTQ